VWLHRWLPDDAPRGERLAAAIACGERPHSEAGVAQRTEIGVGDAIGREHDGRAAADAQVLGQARGEAGGEVGRGTEGAIQVGPMISRLIWRVEGDHVEELPFDWLPHVALADVDALSEPVECHVRPGTADRCGVDVSGHHLGRSLACCGKRRDARARAEVQHRGPGLYDGHDALDEHLAREEERRVQHARQHD